MDNSEKAIRFIENLTLVGDHSGKPFVLRTWQKQIITSLYRGDVSKFFLLLPRKNAKSTLVAAICLFHLLCMEQQQILCAAASQEQATRVYEIIEQMVRQDATLRRPVFG